MPNPSEERHQKYKQEFYQIRKQFGYRLHHDPQEPIHLARLESCKVIAEFQFQAHQLLFLIPLLFPLIQLFLFLIHLLQFVVLI